MTELQASLRRNRAPTHPGELLREDVLPALDLSITDFAAKLHVSRQQIHRVLSTQAGVSPEMALRLGKFCGNGPDLWLNMQKAYDLWHAREKLADEIESISTVAA